eukprot:6211741-Pleurochrysis_carterae.AAC.2
MAIEGRQHSTGYNERSRTRWLSHGLAALVNGSRVARSSAINYRSVLCEHAGTLIAHNVIAHVSSYHMYGWGIYLDEGASEVDVFSNLVHHTTSAGFHQHYGAANRVHRNIFACAGGGVRSCEVGTQLFWARVRLSDACSSPCDLSAAVRP